MKPQPRDQLLAHIRHHLQYQVPSTPKTTKPRKPIGAARPSLSSVSSETPSVGRRPAKPTLTTSGVRSPAGGSRTGSRNSSRQGSTDDLSAPTTTGKASFVRGGYGRQTMPASMRFNRNKNVTSLDKDKLSTQAAPPPPERTTSMRPSSGSTTPGTARRNATRTSRVAPKTDIAGVHTNGVDSGAGEDKKARAGGGNVFARLMQNTPSRRLTKTPETTPKSKVNVKSTTKSSKC